MDQWAEKILEIPSQVYLPGEKSPRESDEVTRKSSHSNYSTLIDSASTATRSTYRFRKLSFLEAAVGIKWRGVIAIAAGVCQQTLCWGMIMTYGSILTFYTKHLLPGTSKHALSLLGAIPPFFVLGLSLLWGRLLDAGHHRKVNIFAGFCLTVGLTGLAYTGDDGDYSDGRYWQILLASIPIGIGQSCYFLAAPQMAKTWYPEKKGFAMGITNSGAAIGGIVWPLVFTEMTARYSFKAGIGTLAAIAAFLGVFIAYAATPAPSFDRRPLAHITRLHTWIPTRGFRSTTFLIHIAAMCCVYLGILTIPFFIEYWAQQSGIGQSEDVSGGLGITNSDGPMTVYLIVIMNACQLPGRLLGSTLCDIIKARKIHAVSCIAAIVIVAPTWLLATTYVQGCVFAAFFGLTLGIMVSLPINDAADILGPHRTHMLGQYAGLVYTMASPFILGGAVISGVLVDYVDTQAVGIWAVCCFGACGLLVTLSLVLPDDTWKFNETTENDRQALCGQSDKSWQKPEV